LKFDAELRRTGDEWDLVFAYNARPLVTQRHSTEESARAEAERRLAELERAGWVRHW